MELGTLGVIIKYAINLESALKKHYETVIARENDLDLKNLFHSKLKQIEKNVKKLKKLQRENTTEMILEPIKDFHSDIYDKISNFDNYIEISTINYFEELVGDFYQKARKKINFLAEVANSFEIIASKHKIR